jgi:hypothetical protein
VQRKSARASTNASRIEKALRSTWEKPGDSFSPKTTVQFNSVTIGKTYPANAQDVVDGVPPDSRVTAALVDFTVRTYYNGTTRAVRRGRETKVYKDKFGEWAVMRPGAEGRKLGRAREKAAMMVCDIHEFRRR